MCEVCDDLGENWSELRPLGAEDCEAENLGCECSTEEILEACGAEARYESTERYVESHFCEEHMREQADLLGAGLMALYQEAGLSEGVAFKAIPEGQTQCDECERPARYANLVTAAWLLCEAHKNWR